MNNLYKSFKKALREKYGGLEAQGEDENGNATAIVVPFDVCPRSELSEHPSQYNTIQYNTKRENESVEEGRGQRAYLPIQ